MVNHSLWRQAHPTIDGMLCLNCLEKRIGRSLCPEDFMDVPLNSLMAEHCQQIESRLYRD